MADEKSILHIDDDWKKQAQEEKRRLAEKEQEQRAAKAAAPAAGPVPAGAGPRGAAPGGRPGAAGEREMPAASLATLVQSLVTQVLFYLGDLSVRGSQPSVNLDMAKHNIDLLGVIEEKTQNNLTDEEKVLLDSAMYEVRMRYVNVASQYIS